MNLRKIYHDTFEVSIWIKAIDGALQIIGSVLILAIKPDVVSGWIRFLTTHELSTDPNDYFAGHLLYFGQHYSQQGQIFGAAYLLVHGVVKVFLMQALWKRKLWAYPVALIIFVLFGAYQMYRFSITHSMLMFILSIFDVIVIILTWIEYKNLKTRAENSA